MLLYSWPVLYAVNMEVIHNLPIARGWTCGLADLI
nr:MAG TPA_asm: hypothetical protein [Caudoviricetes sp.]